MIVEIDNLNFIKIDKKEIIKLFYNIYQPLKKLEYYLDYIKDLVSKSYKDNKFIKKDEFEHLLYNIFLYYLINWDNLYHTNQIPFCNWYNFKEIIDSILNSENDVSFIINQKYINTDYFKRYLENFTNNIKIKNKNIIADYIMENFQGNLIMLYFLIRKMIMNRKSYYKSNILFITDYDRYYGNNRFFGDHLFESEDFKKLLEELNINMNLTNYSILFTKYNYTNLLKYIKDYHKKPSNYLFIEDILNLELGFKILLNSSKIYKKVKLNDDNNDEHKKFIHEMFNIFLKHKLPFILWFYLSIKDYILKNNIKYIFGDSEKNFIFYLYNIYALWAKNIKTIAFSHEIINHNYIFIPVSKKFNCIPNYKLVWNDNVKKLLINKYNFPNNRVLVFPDPRFLYWKEFPKKEKTILFVSQGYPKFYEDIISTFMDKKLINTLIKNGYSFYFKPHPGEYNSKRSIKNINKLKNIKEIKIIDNLDFIPEYTIGMSSTMIYELLNAGSNAYFLDECAKDMFMIDNDVFKKYFRKNIKEILNEILMNYK
ncbi:conserved protein of unknown function [Methanocaldococcus lauensis]|uniref:Uncharacterized protein n=1 Tax=Methanocaldococcus lauensis TaxID=2546128 RepID=A0A8D6SVT6_9EURY|nr:hypothetical protein [Methanocaldococcus lauensis]CAB3290111.1 conserved protein of unknown function [Methanocaldococcus lauensis]